MDFVPFNSRDTRHKSIFGSTAAGESLRFSVLMPRSFQCSKVTLVVHDDFNNYSYHDLYWCGMDGNDKEWWGTDYTFCDAGLYFYHFNYETPFGTNHIYLHSAGAGVFSSEGKEWQQTVYSPTLSTPDWVKGGIMYQIFPDRFNFSGELKPDAPSDRVLHNDITDIPVWKPNEEGKILNNDYYCGDLKGIKEKLPYIAYMGVTILYLNPVFEAHSNHRYNTADYMKIDPLLGNEEDFKALCKEADKYGIKVILDGVFSHTGSDSIYFNREKRYDSTGAFNSQESQYYPWYSFNSDGTYKSWWGIDTLPETNEENEAFIEFITGENGVLKKWLELGASGYRLDVADELPDKFLDALFKSVKAHNKDNFIIGEVWEDASNKFSHGGRRRYLLGNQLDSVMNYPFANAILDFMRYGIAENFMETVVTICENYPKTILDSLMNHIGTHDTARILTRLVNYEIEHKPREIQASFRLSESELKSAKTLLKTATVLQYTLPGFPSLYYGDEAGLQGGSDPFNRAFYPWGKEDKSLISWYKKLGEIRHSLPCLKEGVFKPYSAMLSCVAYTRESEEQKIFVIANKNNHEIIYNLPPEFKNTVELIAEGPVSDSVRVPAFGAVILLKDF
ncbi:MAG: glycoside hydrolase family 13 protein [Clostridia bacterium]|nr:glycoside hydrolase family 13 protein [Clostridia bacterium]